MRDTLDHLRDLVRTLGLTSDNDLTMLVQPVRPSATILLQYRDRVLEGFVVDASWRPTIRDPSTLHRSVRALPSVAPSLPTEDVDILGEIRTDTDGRDVFVAYGPTGGPLPGHDRWSQTLQGVSMLGFGVDFECHICDGVEACGEYLREMSSSWDLAGVRLSVESTVDGERTGRSLQHMFDRGIDAAAGSRGRSTLV